jgi:hypothetical protein
MSHTHQARCLDDAELVECWGSRRETYYTAPAYPLRRPRSLADTWIAVSPAGCDVIVPHTWDRILQLICQSAYGSRLAHEKCESTKVRKYSASLLRLRALVCTSAWRTHMGRPSTVIRLSAINCRQRELSLLFRERLNAVKGRKSTGTSRNFRANI